MKGDRQKVRFPTLGMTSQERKAYHVRQEMTPAMIRIQALAFQMEKRQAAIAARVTGPDAQRLAHRMSVYVEAEAHRCPASTLRFLESLLRWYEAKGYLTDRQACKVEDLLETQGY